MLPDSKSPEFKLALLAFAKVSDESISTVGESGNGKGALYGVGDVFGAFSAFKEMIVRIAS